MQASTCIRESLYIEYHKLLNRNEKNLKKSKGEKMNMKIALVLGALLVLIIGVSCSTAIDFNHNDAQHIKHSGVAVKEISNSSFEKVSVEKTAAEKTQTVKKVTVDKSNAKAVAATKSTKKVESQKPAVKADVKKEAVAKNDSEKQFEKTINGWNPKDHEVSREDLGDGLVRINYDDGYSRVIDQDGNVLSYGY